MSAGVDVAHINVDISQRGHHVRYGTCRRGEDVVGFGECLAPFQIGINVAQTVVVDHKHCVDICLQAFRSVDSAGYLADAFEEERNRDDTYGQDFFLLGYAGNHGSAAGSGAATHAGGDEHHLHVVGEEFLYFGYALFGSCCTDFRLSSGTETSGGLGAEKNLCRDRERNQGLAVGVENYEIHAFHALARHICHGVATAAADAHGDDGGSFRSGRFGTVGIFCE